MAITDYSRVESLIYKGFLTCPMDIGGVPVVLKSLNSNEFDTLALQTYSPKEDWVDYASYLLAYSTLYLNRVNTLVDRPHIINTMAESYKGLPDGVLKYLLGVVTKLNRDAYLAVDLIENYCCGEKSRQQWIMSKGYPLIGITGFHGVEGLGMNTHQRLWVYYNTEEDKNEGFLQKYTLAKFMAGPHAPKEIQKINAADSQRTMEREKKRKARYRGHDYEDGEIEIRVIDESPEELLDQFERSIHGQKDLHDLAIERHQKAIQDAYRARAQEEEARRQLARQEKEEEDDDVFAEDGYTMEEILHIQRASVERRRSQLGGEDEMSTEQKERSLLKWGFIKGQDVPSHRRNYYNNVPVVKNSPIEED